MQDLIIFLSLQAPVLLILAQTFKGWSKSMTLKMHKQYGGKGYCGLPVKFCKVTLYYMPLNENTKPLLSGNR